MTLSKQSEELEEFIPLTIATNNTTDMNQGKDITMKLTYISTNIGSGIPSVMAAQASHINYACLQK